MSNQKLLFKNGFSHRKLCEIGSKYLRYAKNWHLKSNWILIEFCPVGGESPDIFGITCGKTTLIEVKVSKNDFKSDFKKPYRKEGKGIGDFRYYLCPTGIINVNDIPNKWGLLYCDSNGKIELIKDSEKFTEKDIKHELYIHQSLIRRLVGKQQVLDFRVTKNQ